ncbi:sulfite exporter TauE/SafE family protein [Lacticaseibacillus porcinae]|nr:sulfite exporter TauE/SafE family protein [Lacticaseibacillus porcinae]
MENILFGLLIGIFVSLIGGGGASLYLGVLSGQLSTATAVSTSLFVALPALFFGTLTQIHIHNVHFKIGNQLIIAAVPSIIIGTLLSHYIPEKNYTIVIGILLTVMGLIVLRKNLRQQQTPSRPHQHALIAYLLGIISGLMVGLGGLSGGATTVAGLSMMGLTTFEAAGTTTYVLCAMSLVGFISHLISSTIAWSAGLTLMIGAIIGSILTPLVLTHVDLKKLNQPLGIFLGLVVVFFGVKMLLTVF